MDCDFKCSILMATTGYHLKFKFKLNITIYKLEEGCYYYDY